MGPLSRNSLRSWNESPVAWLASQKLTLLGALTIALAAVLVYLPALRIGFLDGWWYLQWAATMDLPRYLIQFLDPANITQGYRPVQGLYIYLLYNLVGFNPDGYHIAHTLLHAANGVLLFAIVRRLGGWRIAFIAALLYVSSPVYSLAVFWHAVVDPLAGFFYLLTVLLWIKYLETGRRLHWSLTFGAYLLALLSKEIAVFLPLILFLIEWWFFKRKPSLSIHLPRYAPFVAAWIPYLYLVMQVQSHGEFAGQFGFRLGPRMLTNLVPYLAVLAFPWTMDLPSAAIYYVWLAVVILAYIAIMLRQRSRGLLLLGLVAILNVLPLTGFPLDYFNTRYLYISLMVSAILIALLFELGWRSLGSGGVSNAAASAIVVLVVFLGGARAADAAAGLAEYTRQLRVPFRDIAQQHASFPDDTYLYFIYSPRTPLVDLQGLFMVRYGTRLLVSGTEDLRAARLFDHQTTFVYYFDEADRPREIRADRGSAPHSSIPLPADFNASIRLEGYEIANATIKRGDPLILLLYWRATGRIDKDYAAFVHLVDDQGQLVDGVDSEPQRGMAPTSRWRVNQFVVDAVILPIASDWPTDQNYRLEIGLYHRPTMQRLSVVDADGQFIGDTIVIEPFSIVP